MAKFTVFKQWDYITLLDSSISAAGSGVELPVNGDDFSVEYTQSGTASQVIVQYSADNTNWYNAVTTRSATFHAIATPPRYIRAITDGSVTMDSHVTIQLMFRK